MPYTAITKYPSSTDLTVFDWSTKDHPNPRLSAPIAAADTTIYFTDAPLDKDGAVITSGFLMGIKNTTGATEIVYVPAAGLSADGLTATGCVRGIRPTGLDYSTGDSSYAMDADQDSPVSCVVDAFLHRAMIAALQGDVASGGTTWKIGDETDSDIIIYAQNADGNKPYWKYDKTTNQFIYSNNGVDETPFGTGAGVTGGDGITVTAGDIDVDLTDTTVFVTTAVANKVPLLDGSGYVQKAQMGASYAEINQSLDGVGATVTAANLDTLTDGSNANALHAHAIKVSRHSRDITAASGAVTYAHGLGSTPKIVRITALSSNQDSRSFGIYDGSTAACNYEQGANCAEASGGVIVQVYESGAANGQSATIAVDATNITLTWTKTGTPGAGTIYMLVSAEG